MILCCGEALIDMIPTETADGTTAYVPHPGGAIFNTSIALGRLGAPVGMFSGVSTDPFGTLLADTLNQNHVTTDLLARSERLTTLAMLHLKNGSATYSFYDEGSAGQMLSSDDLPAVPDAITALYFGGISLVSEPAADAYAALLDQAGNGRVVMIDPNIRPSFITDEAAYRARLDRMIAGADIVKVSDEDLAWIVGDTGTLAEQAHALLAKGPRFVIVTKGADGALAICNETSVEVPSRRATVVDTVGAGDTFNAGVLAALHQSGQLTSAALATMTAADLKDALDMGARVAAVTVSRAGANPPWPHELVD